MATATPFDALHPHRTCRVHYSDPAFSDWVGCHSCSPFLERYFKPFLKAIGLFSRQFSGRRASFLSPEKYFELFFQKV
jgi:hypothetical protein